MSGWAGAQNLHADSGKAIAYSGMTDCFRRTVQEEGFKALFKVPCPPPPIVSPTVLTASAVQRQTPCRFW